MKVFKEKYQWFKKSDFVFFSKLFIRKAQEVARTELYILSFLAGFLSSVFFHPFVFFLVFIALLIVLYRVYRKAMDATYEECEKLDEELTKGVKHDC